MSNVPPRLTIATTTLALGSNRSPFDPGFKAAHRSVPLLYCDKLYSKDQPTHLNCVNASKGNLHRVLLHPVCYDISKVWRQLIDKFQKDQRVINRAMMFLLNELEPEPEKSPFHKVTEYLLRNLSVRDHGVIWYRNNSGTEYPIPKFEELFWACAERIQAVPGPLVSAEALGDPTPHPLVFAAANAFVYDMRLPPTSTPVDLVGFMCGEISRAQQDATTAREDATSAYKQSVVLINESRQDHVDITKTTQEHGHALAQGLIGLMQQGKLRVAVRFCVSRLFASAQGQHPHPPTLFLRHAPS